ncbi:uncharacterized protein LOC124353686 [Homalodisca vitripennis]|nr:uncharacterized protein LOC124353686 [Homalodisca vitripennis]KAG8274070.1 hypothetical protein J6590_008199 [Homalodisca vitripennis]
MVHTLVGDIYHITRYKFRNESLLSEVFAPPSLHNDSITSPNNYERLEFLGDSVLNMVVSIILFELYPLEKEGDLTLRKNHLVSGRKLVEISRSLGFMRLMPDSSMHWRRESDALEALIGAIYLDGGFKCVKQFILNNWRKPARQLRIAPIDAKSQLYIWAQRRHLPPPLYRYTNLTENYTMSLQLRETHGLGVVRIMASGIKKKGEIDAARAMLARIENRSKWKTLFKSVGDYITEEDLNATSEDIKVRLRLWCLANNFPLPEYKIMEGETADRRVQFTCLVSVGVTRGAYGVSTSVNLAEKKAAFKMLLRLCDEEREKILLDGWKLSKEIDVCIPRNFKSLIDEWVTKNHLGEMVYTSEELISKKLFNVSLTIPTTDLGTVSGESYKKRLAEHRAAANMIEKVVTRYRSGGPAGLQQPDIINYKIELHSWAHSRQLPLPQYKVENVSGLGHSLLFTVSVAVDGLQKAVASGYNKRSAQQAAASIMLEQIKATGNTI